MSNQDLGGKAPAGAAPGKPESPEQLLAREREARALMRDRLRNTESLAAESHALRERMAQELERVTAERDRLRSAVAAASTTATAGAAAAPTAPVEPTLSPADAARMARAFDPPPQPPSRGGPWRALAMLGGLAVGVAALAWLSGSLPGESELAASSTSTPAPVAAAERRAPGPAASVVVATTPAAAASAVAVPPSNGAVALPPLAPEAQLAAAPTAAGPSSSGMAARLRAALDGEGIASPVDIDGATGHVAVADPQADYAQRDRTDMVIRAVYAGANLPEPQIEHRWLSPMRGAHVAAASAPSPAPGPVSPAAAYAARHATTEHAGADHRQKPADVAMADAEEPRAILPAGRVTAACKSDLAGKSTAHHGAAFMACMKHSCCSPVNRQTEECRAYDKAYPFTCSAG